MEKIHLKRSKRVLDGHLWIFSNELYESPRQYIPGSLVEVYDRKETYLGTGYINPRSLISVRLLTREKEAVDRDFLRERIRRAVDLRKRLYGDRSAMRLVFSEGDYLPGLIVDRYAECLVLQFLTLGMETMKHDIIELLDEEMNPSAIVLKNDSGARKLEGLPLFREIFKGDLSALPVIDEEGIVCEVNPLGGQKTGLFLDQRENRRAFGALVQGGRGLDLFCYTGAWSLRMASKGASVTGVDSSEGAIAQAERNAGLNNLQDSARFVAEDVFLFLEKEVNAAQNAYDYVVLDPPAFVKSAGKIREALKAYRSLNALCMKLLKPGGLLATSSCSYHLGREMFLDMLRAAAKDSGRCVRMIALRSQSADHPVVLAMPETEYLKCAFLLIE